MVCLQQGYGAWPHLPGHYHVMSVEVVVATEEHKHVAGEPVAVQPLRLLRDLPP
jgi:hypothetical protein